VCNICVRLVSELFGAHRILQSYSRLTVSMSMSIGLEEQGLFRRSPNSALLRQVREAYNRGTYPSSSLLCALAKINFLPQANPSPSAHSVTRTLLLSSSRSSSATYPNPSSQRACTQSSSGVRCPLTVTPKRSWRR
jgi:hypothetical protein